MCNVYIGTWKLYGYTLYYFIFIMKHMPIPILYSYITHGKLL